MSIAEAGGPTTQAGISYQNAIAALYLGQMLDPKPFIASKKVVEVRVEAPEDVDDVVVTFANESKLYIHVKESVSKANDPKSAWGKVWKDFEAQFNRSSFQTGRDKLQLCSGLHKVEIEKAQDLCQRASSSQSYEEWKGKLPPNLTLFLEHLKTFLSPELKNDSDKLLIFFKSMAIEFLPRKFVEEKMIWRIMPDSNQTPQALFSLLRDLVGGTARIRGVHSVDNLKEWQQENNVIIPSTVHVEELRRAVYSASSILRHHKNTVGKTGKHLLRNTSKVISHWLLETTDEEPVGVLLDQAGTGKTVLIQEILEELERQNVDVLAIKADQQLSGVESLDDLQSKLDLPIRVERLAGMLPSPSRFVVLIDQIDALSLSMAHDQRALNLTLDLIFRLRSIPGVRILITCRRFDFNSDPRLKNLEGCKSFHLEEFSAEEVGKVLDGVGLDYNLLLPSTQKLLRTPLHLNLFLMAFESGASQTSLQDRGFTSLQELYHLVWDSVIMKQHPAAPPVWEREQALLLMAKYMDREQKITVPKSFFTKKETILFERAVHWLSSEGIILDEGNSLGFFHQTFFDYCYARDFVDQGRSLVETLLASPQGLFQRPQLVQVLSYLRGSNNERVYAQQLTALFKSDSLRYHLKSHLIRWFASLPSLTEYEWRLVKRFIQNKSMRSQLLQFSNGNPGWFEFWRVHVLPDLLDEDEEGYEEAFGYLNSVIDLKQKEVIEFLRPYYMKNPRLEQIIKKLILRIRKWKSPEAVQMLESVVEKISFENQSPFYSWGSLAEYDPEVVIRILRHLMDQALENYKLEKQARNKFPKEPYQISYVSLRQEINKVVSSNIKNALELVVEHSAIYFLEMFIPWVIAALHAKSDRSSESRHHFISDMLFSSWYENVRDRFEDAMKVSLISSFVKLANEQPQKFLEKIKYLSGFPYQSIQFLVARVLREVPQKYATTSLQFLLSDPRRLKIGESDFESRQLIKAVFPYLQNSERQELENFILNCVPLDKQRKLEGYRFHDLRQLRLLLTITYDSLNVNGKKRLLELERKFPGYSISNNPSRFGWSKVVSPIASDKVSKMSDRQWLKAMTKYQGEENHFDWSKGGAGELARLLERLVIENPQRFFKLATQCDLQLDHHYVYAFLIGLAESDAPADLLFMSIFHFKDHQDHNVWRTISRAVEKRANADVPKQIISLLKTYLHDPLITEAYNDPTSGYLNSIRGTAMKALMRVFSTNEEKQIHEIWSILCYAVQSEDISLRAGAICELVYMIRHDRQRAIDLCETAIAGSSQLYQVLCSEDFCYWAMGKPFMRLIPHLIELLNHDDEEVQQRGAELVAIALISTDLFENQDVQEILETLLEKAIVGPPPHRRGVARVFSINLLKNPCPILLNGLTRLIGDNNEDIQQQVSSFLFDINETPQALRKDVRSFISAFAESRSVVQSHNLGEVLWKQAEDQPEWTLSVINRVLKNEHVRSAVGWDRIGSSEMIHAVMNIYKDPLSDEDLQSQAMDTFDSLMELYSAQAQGLLAEWDRR